MQVGQFPPVRRPSAAGAAHTSVVPELLQLLQPSPAARARRDQLVEQNNRRDRRRELNNAQALAAQPPPERPSDVMRAAEQELRAGSAARRDYLRDQSGRAPSSDRGFRQALATASNPRPQAAPANAPGAAPSRAAALGTAPAHGTAGSEPSAPVPKGTAPAAPPAAGARVAPAGPVAAAPLQVAPATAGAAPRAAGAPRVAVAEAPTAISAARGASTSGTGTRAGGEPPTVAGAAGTGSDRRAARVGAPRVPAPVDDAGNSDANVERIVRLLATRLTRERSVTTLRLDPPELGTIRLHLDLRQDQLVLQVDTQTTAAQRLLEEQLDTLRRNLEAAGVHLERVEIRAPHPGPGTPDSGAPTQGQTPTDGQQGAPDPDAQSARGGSSRDREVPSGPVDPAPEPQSSPATESLVNLLA